MRSRIRKSWNDDRRGVRGFVLWIGIAQMSRGGSEAGSALEGLESTFLEMELLGHDVQQLLACNKVKR